MKKYSRSSFWQPWLLIVVFWIIVLGLSWFHFQNKSSPSQQANSQETYQSQDPSYSHIRVSRIIDGDTFELENGERVRLIGVDTPESRKNAKASRDSKRTKKDLSTIIRMGLQAKVVLDNLLRDKTVSLEFDVTKRDKYGRLLAYVYVDQNSTGLSDSELTRGNKIFINAAMVKLGYAAPMTIPPNVKYVKTFATLYKEARDQKKGLWESDQLAFE